MTEAEREEYRVFLEAHPELENEILNAHRRYYRQHLNESDVPNWYRIEDGGEAVGLSRTRRKGGQRNGPDYLDMIEQADCDRSGEEHYRDPLIKQAVQALSEKQRQAMEYTVLYEIPTAKLAKAWGCNERNVRKLRERALHNVCEKYAAALKKKPGHTLAEREFLEWYDALVTASEPPVRERKRRQGKQPAKSYRATLGQYAALVAIPQDIIKESLRL